MREWFYKLLPYGLGSVVAYVALSASSFISTSDFLNPLLLVAILLGGTLVATIIALSNGLPRDVSIQPVPGEAPPRDAKEWIESFESLGFVPEGDPLRIDLRPSATLWPFVHRELQCSGAVFSTGTLPPRSSFEIITGVEGDRGALTSGPNPDVFVLPCARGYFRQVLRGAPPAHLLAHHLKATSYLAECNLALTKSAPGTPAERVRQSVARQRRAVMASPVRSAAIVLWRVITKRNPYELPIAKQRSTPSSIAYLKGLTSV